MKTLNSEYGLSGTEPVINQECMLVHEKVDICQFEWYRDNKDFITVSSLWVWDGFLFDRSSALYQVKTLCGMGTPQIFSPVRQQTEQE